MATPPSPNREPSSFAGDEEKEAALPINREPSSFPFLTHSQLVSLPKVELAEKVSSFQDFMGPLKSKERHTRGALFRLSNEEMASIVLCMQDSLLQRYEGFPLFMASLLGDASKLDDLICKGANIEGMDSNGNTCLHAASYFGGMEAVKVLIGRNANATLKNKEGFIPYDLGNKDIQAIFQFCFFPFFLSF